MWDKITYPFPNFNGCIFENFNGCTVEVCEWMSNFKPDFTEREITDPCWNLS